MRKRLAFVCVMVIAVSGSSFGWTQDSSRELAELRARLEAVERENRDLQQVVRRLPSVDSPSAVSSSGGTTQETSFINQSPAVDEAAVRSIIENYMREQELQQKADEDRIKAAGYEVGSDLSMTANWNNGLELSTKNKDFRVHVGGRSQLDVGWFSADQNVQNNINVPYGDGIDFRRARLRIDGTMYETMEWAVEYDLVNSTRVRNQPMSATNPGFFDQTVTAPTDLWWTFKQVPWLGNVRIGNQKEAIGFEHLTSSRWLSFMERSYNQDTFYGGVFNGFNPGIAAFNNWGDDDMGFWQVGVYKPCNSVFAFNTGDGDYSVTARITRLLWYVDDGRGLLHVGMSGRQATGVSQAGVPGRIQTFRTRDAIRTGLSADWPVTAGIALFGDDIQWGNAELAAVYGPWTLQAEYLVSNYQDARTTFAGPSVGNVVYHGGYAQLLYFLTGESNYYNKKTAVFERTTPRENFFFVRDARGGNCFGLGAWQVGARYDYLDLNDKGLDGGTLHNLTAGLNWFWNPNMKMQFNYSATFRDAALAPVMGNADPGDGWIHGWGVRFAQDF